MIGLSAYRWALWSNQFMVRECDEALKRASPPLVRREEGQSLSSFLRPMGKQWFQSGMADAATKRWLEYATSAERRTQLLPGDQCMQQNDLDTRFYADGAPWWDEHGFPNLSIPLEAWSTYPAPKSMNAEPGMGIFTEHAVLINVPFPAIVRLTALSVFFEKHHSLDPEEAGAALLEFLKQWAFSVGDVAIPEPQVLQRLIVYLKFQLQQVHRKSPNQ